MAVTKKTATTTKTAAKPKKTVAVATGGDVFHRHEQDTGSPEAQLELLSQEIESLQQHLAAHKHDYDAKRSLLKKVAKRRTFLKYLKQTNLERYSGVSKKLGLKV